MNTATRNLIVILVLTTVPPFQPTAADPGPEIAAFAAPEGRGTTSDQAERSYTSSRPAARPARPAITAPLTIVGGTDEQRTKVNDAVELFATEGLELPTLIIEIHDTDDGCDGYEGVFRSREMPMRLDICNTHRFIVMHELAHAWENNEVTDVQRDEFLDLRGLTVWNDGSSPWKERGIEDLAEVVVWGLLKLSRSQPVGNDPDRAQSFQMLTGIDLTLIESSSDPASPNMAQWRDPTEASFD